MNQSLPRISIITVCFNAEKYLERTIQSIITQTYPHIEYLIIDGQSKDGTLDIIKKYEANIDQWISEPDKGLYDAMNKGMELAKGDFVWFMNAGDEIRTPEVLTDMFAKETDGDVYYGETEFLDLERNPLGIRSKATPHRLPEQLHWKDMQQGMVVCHQSILVRKSIAEPYDYEQHPYSADIDWVIKVLKRSKKTINAHQILAIYLQGGFSRKHLKASLKDRYQILKKHYGLWTTLKNHVLIVLRSVWFILKRGKGY
ncbi:glycosyltransferase family 2 protein [uncultured Microscilla sp.]|uniref:glycosyltransferase family 2 protein n=1 Tax=uncultured Microscilla sp. TaxID=432653 RepID=UPI002603C917|nr:glycosyltransferase family 2 protein [uncultured Microscilla sp.]